MTRTFLAVLLALVALPVWVALMVAIDLLTREGDEWNAPEGA